MERAKWVCSCLCLGLSELDWLPENLVPEQLNGLLGRTHCKGRSRVDDQMTTAPPSPARGRLERAV